MVIGGQLQRPVGELLREWREHRRRSQLELALDAEISARHLSFVETGRSQPSRSMILLLAEHLEVPLRERNRLLLAAGYAPVYAQTDLDSPRMSAVRDAVQQVLRAHEPYPAVVVDRQWNLVAANTGIAMFTHDIAPELMEPPVNVLRVSLHPRGMATHIINLGEWRAHILSRLRRQLTLTADSELARLYEELRAYPCEGPDPEVEIPGPSDIVIPLRIRHGDGELAFLSTVATFGTPLDITVAELAIESFYPADIHTATVLTSTVNDT